MLIPANKIQKGKYTIGGELIDKITNIPYKGYYYILNNLYFVGKDYNSNARELIKVSDSNKLIEANFSAANYSLISGITSQDLQTPKVNYLQFNTSDDPTRYFYKKVNENNPIVIREIDKENYDKIKNNPLFQTTFLDDKKSLAQAEKELPGLTLFLRG
jgi:hypothetical protein